MNELTTVSSVVVIESSSDRECCWERYHFKLILWTRSWRTLLHNAPGSRCVWRVHSTDGNTCMREMTSWPPS